MFEMPTHDEMRDVLHSDFDIETHKNTFIDYLEVIIDEDGKVMYAVPSHTEKLYELYTKKNDITREEVLRRTICSGFPMDVAEYLCKELKCICVWNNAYKGEPNQKQLNKLKTLRLSGIYRGPVHNTYEEQRNKYRKIARELREFANNYKGDVSDADNS